MNDGKPWIGCCIDRVLGRPSTDDFVSAVIIFLGDYSGLRLRHLLRHRPPYLPTLWVALPEACLPCREPRLRLCGLLSEPSFGLRRMHLQWRKPAGNVLVSFNTSKGKVFMGRSTASGKCFRVLRHSSWVCW